MLGTWRALAVIGRSQFYFRRFQVTIYDELIVEIDEKEDVERCKRDLVECMTTELPPWCASWPIKAEAWAERRYRKG